MSEVNVNKVSVVIGMSPKDFFLYLGTAITLYFSVGSLLTTLFGIINLKFPDTLTYYGGDSLIFALSSLLITFPIYLILTWRLRKDIAEDPDKYNLTIRKWFVWLTLFLAGGTIAGDLIALLRTFLLGEITTRFILKVLAVLIVAGATFWYYLYDLRRAQQSDTRLNKTLLIGAVVCMIAIFVGAIALMGSPTQQRAFRMDEQRENDLRQIQWQILNYWQSKEALPASLEDIQDDFSGFTILTDPETKETYGYRVISPLAFELCATFARASDDRKNSSLTPYYGSSFDETFVHDAGRTCFERTIDPELYPPFQTEKSGLAPGR